MQKEEMFDFHIRNVWQKIARMYNAQGAQAGLTMAQGFVLLNINNKQGTPSTKLGPAMGMESTSLSRILKSMEDKGLIQKQQDKEDGRMVRLFLTKEGLRVRKLAKKNVLCFNQHLYDHLEPKKIEHFLDVMTSINTILSEHNIFESKTVAK